MVELMNIPENTKQKPKHRFTNKGNIFLLIGCVLVVFGYILFRMQPSFQHSRTPLPGNIDAMVTIQLPQTGSYVPKDFIGFSIELSQICEIVRLDEQKPTYYEQLYRNLGSGVLHVGGHTSDLSIWVPDGVASCNSTQPIVTKTLVNSFFAFARRIRWKVTWGLNLISNDPIAAADEAAYIVATAGADLMGFTIGNEPDLYVKHGYRSSGWSDTDYLNEWEQYRSIVLQVAPSAHFIGPDTCCESPMFSNFLSDEGKNIILASHHYYITSLHTKYTTPVSLLSRTVAQQFSTFATEWVALAQEAGLSLEISEANTIAGGGVLGISNSFAAALWASDYLFQAEVLHIRRVDFQNSSMAAYNVIDSNGIPQTLYYGLLFFHLIAEETHAVQATIQSSLNITAYAFIGIDRSLHIALVNKESQYAATVRIAVEYLYHSATMMQLIAPDLSATKGITLGKKAVSTQGTWVPASPAVLSLHGTEMDVKVPAGSAMYIDLSP